MIGVVIVTVTGGIISIGYFLFQGLDDNSKQLNAMKVRRETSVTPMIDIVPFVDKNVGIAAQHPLCEKLFQQAELLRGRGLYQKAIDTYEQSKRAYMHDVGSKSLDTFDKLHLSVRVNLIAQCYVAMDDYQKALEPAVNATNAYPTSKGLTLLAGIYDHLKMSGEASETRRRSADMPGTPEFKQNLLNAIK
jgi:tetratricopeptide (TPR) repeat protein